MSLENLGTVKVYFQYHSYKILQNKNTILPKMINVLTRYLTRVCRTVLHVFKINRLKLIRQIWVNMVYCLQIFFFQDFLYL